MQRPTSTPTVPLRRTVCPEVCTAHPAARSGAGLARCIQARISTHSGAMQVRGSGIDAPRAPPAYRARNRSSGLAVIAAGALSRLKLTMPDGPESRRRHSRELPEMRREVAVAGKPHRVGDGRDGVIGRHKELLAAPDTPLDQIAMWRNPHGHVEGSGEVLPTQARNRRHGLARNALVQVFLDESKHSPQPMKFQATAQGPLGP